MGSTRIDVFLHITWQTRHRRSILEGDLERFVHDQIRDIAADHHLEPLAVNSAWDHTHTLLQWDAGTSIATVVQQMKGRTAYRWNNEIQTPSDAPELRWQEGYGAFSIRKSEVGAVQTYIDYQKEHHRERKLWWRFERHLWRQRRQ